MRTCRLILLLYIILLTYSGFSQRIELLHDGNGVSLRALNAVTDKIVWVCGNKGTVGGSVDGGNNWEWIVVPNYGDRGSGIGGNGRVARLR